MTRHTITKPEFVRENVDLLADFRERRNMKRTKLSELTGIKVDMIEHYEHGYQLPTKANYNKLAEVFGWQKWEE